MKKEKKIQIINKFREIDILMAFNIAGYPEKEAHKQAKILLYCQTAEDLLRILNPYENI